MRHKHDNCITIDASYVIVRGLTLKGAGAADNTSSKPIGAIVITGGHDIIIEDCDISDWGRLDPKTGFGFNYESAIYLAAPPCSASSSNAASCMIRASTAATGMSRNTPRTRRGRSASACSMRVATM